MTYCTNCGKPLGDDFDFCPECGAKVVKDSEVDSRQSITTKRCASCGAEMPIDAYYCLNCGRTFDTYYDDFETIKKQIEAQYGTWKNKWIAWFLCLFLGWIGAHKYFEGKIGMGILYTCTFGLCGWGWIIDTIILLFKPNPYFVRK